MADVGTLAKIASGNGAGKASLEGGLESVGGKELGARGAGGSLKRLRRKQ